MLNKFEQIYKKMIFEQSDNFQKTNANSNENPEMIDAGFTYEGGNKYSKEISEGFFFPVILYVNLNENGHHTANLALKDPSYIEDAKKTLWFCNDDATSENGKGNLLVVDESTSINEFLNKIKTAIQANLEKVASDISENI